MSQVYHIPKGTKLYRCQPDYNSIEVRLCSDTHKVGIYFGDHELLALGMCIEYQKDMMLGTFVTTRDLELLHGKYSYRTSRYYDQDGNLILDIDPTPEENIPHIDTTIMPIDNNHKQLLRHDIPMAEIFITDLTCVELIDVKKISHARLYWHLKDAGLT